MAKRYFLINLKVYPRRSARGCWSTGKPARKSPAKAKRPSHTEWVPNAPFRVRHENEPERNSP